MTSRPLPLLFPALLALALAAAGGQSTAYGSTQGAQTGAASEPGAPPAEPTQVLGLRRDHAYVYVVEGDSFRRAERVDATSLALPRPVLREARGTYVQIEGTDGPIWLERIQLELDRAKQINAACSPGLSSASTRTIAATSGAGEGC